jgi:hypothetical protein
MSPVAYVVFTAALALACAAAAIVALWRCGERRSTSTAGAADDTYAR